MDYWKALKSWHKKASQEEDYFIKFFLEYISFISYLNMNRNSKTDRPLIQNLKQDNDLRKKYLERVDNDTLKDLILHLESDPIQNETNPDDKWWDFDGENLPNGHVKSPHDGKIASTKDFRNIIEFIYRARNNLFHGHKLLDYEEDLIIVTYGYKILYPLMEIVIEEEEY